MNNIHTGKLLASLREAGAYEGLSAYLLRQAIPRAEGSSLAALVRDRQAQAPGLSRTQAVQDLAAEYVDSRLFTDVDAIRQLAEARPETARQILDWLRSAESPDESLIQAEKLYTQALGDGEEGYSNVELEATVNHQTDESADKLDWNKIVSKSGETRLKHLQRHAVPMPERASHGVFNGDPQTMVEAAWKNRGNVTPIDDGMGAKIYHIPMKNAGYESGYRNTGKEMNFITIIVMDNTSDIITAYPSFGELNTEEGKR